MTMSVRRDLCSVMVFEVVEQSGTVILHHKKEVQYNQLLFIHLQLDHWYVILNGAVEISHPEGRTETLCMGNSFGISPSLDKQYMNGEVRSKGDDCQYPYVVQSNVLLYYKFTRCPHVVLDQFVCIAQEDYWRILNHVEKNTHKVEEEGEIVMVKEHRELDRSGTRKGHIVIKGTPERLIMHLVEEPSVVDPTYIEDFLLTYRTFLSSPMDVGRKLLEWFQVDSLRDTKASRESQLNFSVQGGSERGFGVFVESVEEGSKAAEAGLKRGDQEKKGNRFSIADLPGDMEFPTDSKTTRKMKANTVSGGRNKIRKMLEKTRFSILPPKPFR
ncbi:hypothetical protein GOODEAATRI_000140 [Goodea atripinnis]|uniref:PDZ domain-containing protein n=1 Tax=Goodea atripinnis TaxID=208336 RepID=A0ABV0NHC8_9TELE